MTFSYTSSQAENIATKWNAHANVSAQIAADNIHHLFGDNADDDIATNGITIVELSSTESSTGVPVTFYVTSDDVMIEE